MMGRRRGRGVRFEMEEGRGVWRLYTWYS